MAVFGDDDPEHNIPFSVERTEDRPETEEALGHGWSRSPAGEGMCSPFISPPPPG